MTKKNHETIKAFKEQQGEIRAAMQAILDKASKESRTLTDDEIKSFDAKELEFANISSTIKRMESMPEIQDVAPGREIQPGANRQDLDILDRIVVPPQARYHTTRLSAFAGEAKPMEAAYLAGQFILATVIGNRASRLWCENLGIVIRNAMGGESNTAGGYLTPVEMERAIIRLVEQYGVARANARIIPMGSDTKDVPVRESGLTTYWPGEGVAITPSDLVFGNAQLVAKKLAALAVYSSEVDEDAVIDLGNLIVQEIAAAFAQEEDSQFFNGTGSPMNGVWDRLQDGSIVTSGATRISFEKLTFADFEKVIGTLPDFPGINPKWYVSKPGAYASMWRLLDAAGGNTISDLSAGVRPQFLGYDVVYTQVLDKTLGDDAGEFKLIFGDLNLGSIMGVRRGVTISRSTELKFAEDQLAIKGTERVAVNVHSRGTSTTDGGAAGAILALKTADS